MDKIQINLIFHDQLRAINTLPIGNAHIVKYTRGGHILLVVDRNGIRCFNAYTLKPVCDIIRRDGTKIIDLKLADMDRGFAVVHSTGKIERWELPSFKLIEGGSEDIDEEVKGVKKEKFLYRGIDFI